MDTQYLTTQQVAERIHASPRTVARWRHERRGPNYRRVGNRVLYPARFVDDWLVNLPDPFASVADVSVTRPVSPVSRPAGPVNGPQNATQSEMRAALTEYACHSCARTFLADDDAQVTAQGWVQRNNTWLCTACSYTQ